MEANSENEAVPKPRLVVGPQRVLFAESPPGFTFGAVSNPEPSSLTLLAAGVAGMAARRARRRELVEQWQTKNPQA